MRAATIRRRCPATPVSVGILFLLLNVINPSVGSKIIRTSAKSLAEKAGAAQYAVHIEEELTSDEIGGKHDLKKRRTDNGAFDDSDYEIYQGVVGRPGIDFPVLAGIPQTAFNCRKFGNGYFADLETECQVFHICEGGKKISFLCPNGTIFQQTDLICDWWFRVNCNASPGHYAESSEVLSRAQNHRTSTKKANHFNSDAELILGVTNHQDSKSDRRLKSGHTFTLRSKEPLNLSEEVSDESLDFDEVVPPKKTFKSRGSKRGGRQEERITKESSHVQSSSHETQEFAETASFVSSKNSYNTGYLYQQPIHVPDVEPENTTQVASPKESPDTPKQEPEFNGYYHRQQTKRPKKIEPQTEYTRATTTAAPITVPRRGTTTYKSQSRQKNFNESPNQYSVQKESTSYVDEKRRSNTHTTARRIQTSRTTPYYTPTVPSIIQRPSTAQHVAQKPTYSEFSPTTETSPPSEHAIEMMRTLHELKLDTMPTSNVEQYSDERAGLVVPPSSGPDTLHSLALYFATAVDNLVAKQETPKSEDRSEKSLDVTFGNITKVTSTLVSNKTVNNYESLFGIEDTKKANATTNVDNRFAGDDNNDLDTDYSTNPILAAAGSPQIRELAQVFTHALSAYLHDPSTFRRVLSEIRPTEPPALHHTDDILSNRIGRTEDFNKGSGATYLPTQQMLTATPSSLLPATEDLEVLDFSDVTVSTLKKDSFYPSTTPSTYPDSTTNNNALETELPTISSLKSVNLSLKTADRVPASRFLTEQLEKNAQSSLDSRFEDESSETNNPIAMEINGGLIISTSFPYFQDESLEVQNNTFEDNNYFPGDSADQSTVPNQYGANFVTGSPVSNGWDKQPDKSLPSHWGSASTADFNSFGTTAAPPSALLSVDLLPPTGNRQPFSLPINDILPPTLDDNDLQHAQSQSLVASGNQLLRERERAEKQTTSSYTTEAATTSASVSGHYITQTYTASPDHLSRSTLPDTGRISTNSWSTSYTVFLDPHTINDGLMNGHHELNTITPSPNTYLPKSTQTPSYSDQYTTETSGLDSRFGDSNRQGKDYAAPAAKPNDYMEVMQKKANEMFGNLNDTSASHLMNVMKKANKNKTVRKLILLLIQTCDDDYNTTVEESRTALLNALIGMDGHLIDEDSELQVITSPRRSKSIANRGSIKARNSATSTETPITTFRRPYFVSPTTSEPQYLFESTSTLPIEPFETTTLRDYDDYHTTRNGASSEDTSDFSTVSSYSTLDYSTSTYSPTTWAPQTTRRTAAPSVAARSTATPLVSSKRPLPPTSESKRIAKDLDDLLGQASQSYDPEALSNRANKYSDSRALDLLRSLYSLAGRFGRR